MENILSQPQYSVTQTESQTAVAEWLQAVKYFHYCYTKIGKVLDEKAATLSPQSASYSRRTKELVKSRQYMKDVLETLLLDMGKSTGVAFRSNEPISSNTGQLVVHTQLLAEICRKVGKELSHFSAAQAN